MWAITRGLRIDRICSIVLLFCPVSCQHLALNRASQKSHPVYAT